jgi:hypothetical protein
MATMDPDPERPASPRPARRFLALAATVLLAPGCGDEGSKFSESLYPVSGKVVMDDGQPVTNARVVFVRGTINASGELGADGTFKLTTGGRGEGAPAGEYKVKVEPASSAIGKGHKPPFPVRYEDEDSSELTATVKPETNDLPPFTLSSKAAPAKKAGRPTD